MKVSAREKIIESAYRLFYRQGLRATQVDQVIQESEVAKRTFYKHFPSKQDVVMDALQERHQRWMQWFTDRVEALNPPGKERVLGIFDALREWFDDPEFRGCAFLNVTAEIYDAQEPERELARRHKQDMDEKVAQWLREAGVEDADLARQIGMLIDGAIIRAQCFGDADYAGAARSLCATLIRI
ncbi:TetR/AcrR family transcriptional regulator [Hahella aquimaris]|uniref:TetR/AcrR family transcriptional regulator n=1 Tax=Hahella sp. HNIBRBA332 TaxID=3015983 RepID=UPI00273B6976|nr:TetR/AcrR family transcriptional regulator [Hahella sp. HNIBRBA332]WLQ13363.1 TetR/AcrR family transcriptional regulator [Hahella sp. HNIBRBA332]